MRVVPNDIAVLECSRLTFIGVAYKVALTWIVARHETPLEASRKTGAAAPAQPGGLDLVDNIFGRDFFLENFAQRLVTPHAPIRFNRPWFFQANLGQANSNFLAHQFKFSSISSTRCGVRFS